MKRPRMTIRRWMVVVAFAAVVCLGIERTIALQRLRQEQAVLEELRALKAQNQAVQARLLFLIQAEKTAIERAMADEARAKGEAARGATER